MHGNLCCMSSCSKHHGVWHWSVWRHQSSSILFFKFQVCLDIFGTPSAPTYLILQSQTTFGAMSKVRYTKHILQMVMTWVSKFRSLFKGSIRKHYCVLLLYFHCIYSSIRVCSNVVVTYNLSYSTTNVYHEFS